MTHYKELNPTEQCPHCYSRDVKGHLEDSGYELIREMSCLNCYADWEVFYTICNFDTVTIPVSPIPDPNRHVVHLRTT